MDQVHQGTSRSAAAVAPSQVQRADGPDRASVAQLPSSLSERPGAPVARASEDTQGPLSQSHTGAPSTRRVGSVDADEIARLLDRGEAASIDAAAAIASGVALPASASEESDLEQADDTASRALPRP